MAHPSVVLAARALHQAVHSKSSQVDEAKFDQIETHAGFSLFLDSVWDVSQRSDVRGGSRDAIVDASLDLLSASIARLQTTECSHIDIQFAQASCKLIKGFFAVYWDHARHMQRLVQSLNSLRDLDHINISPLRADVAGLVTFVAVSPDMYSEKIQRELIQAFAVEVIKHLAAKPSVLFPPNTAVMAIGGLIADLHNSLTSHGRESVMLPALEKTMIEHLMAGDNNATIHGLWYLHTIAEAGPACWQSVAPKVISTLEPLLQGSKGKLMQVVAWSAAWHIVNLCSSGNLSSHPSSGKLDAELLEWILSRLPDASSGDVVSSLATKCLSILGDAKNATSTNHYVSLEPILAYATKLLVAYLLSGKKWTEEDENLFLLYRPPWMNSVDDIQATMGVVTKFARLISTYVPLESAVLRNFITLCRAVLRDCPTRSYPADLEAYAGGDCKLHDRFGDATPSLLLHSRVSILSCLLHLGTAACRKCAPPSLVWRPNPLSAINTECKLLSADRLIKPSVEAVTASLLSHGVVEDPVVTIDPVSTAVQLEQYCTAEALFCLRDVTVDLWMIAQQVHTLPLVSHCMVLEGLATALQALDRLPNNTPSFPYTAKDFPIAGLREWRDANGELLLKQLIDFALGKMTDLGYRYMEQAQVILRNRVPATGRSEYGLRDCDNNVQKTTAGSRRFVQSLNSYEVPVEDQLPPSLRPLFATFNIDMRAVQYDPDVLTEAGLLADTDFSLGVASRCIGVLADTVRVLCVRYPQEVQRSLPLMYHSAQFILLNEGYGQIWADVAECLSQCGYLLPYDAQNDLLSLTNAFVPRAISTAVQALDVTSAKVAGSAVRALHCWIDRTGSKFVSSHFRRLSVALNDILPQFDESHSAEDKAKWDAAKVFFYDNVHLLLRMIFSGALSRHCNCNSTWPAYFHQLVKLLNTYANCDVHPSDAVFEVIVTWASVSESMKEEAIPYIKGWMPTVLSLLTKEDLKPAAIYALGAFTLASKGTIANCTAALNEVVLPMAATGDLSGDWLASADDTGFVDFLSTLWPLETLRDAANIAVCKSALHTPIHLLQANVVEIIVRTPPIWFDPDEAGTVLSAVELVVRETYHWVAPNLEVLLRGLAYMLRHREIEPSVKVNISRILQSLMHQHPADMATVLPLQSPPNRDVIAKALAAVPAI